MRPEDEKFFVLRMIEQGYSHRHIQKVSGVGLGTISRWRNEGEEVPDGTEDRVLVIGDPHEPCSRDGYLEFCRKIERKYNTNKTVVIGDLAEHSVISFHNKHPKAPGGKREYELMKDRIEEWHHHFPNAKVCIGNHDERPARLAVSVNMEPSIYLKKYNDVWNTPTWDWDFSHIIGDVKYFHGTGCSGKYPYANASHREGRSVVIGHCHSVAGIYWNASADKRWFGMSVGCGVNDKTYAFEYGKNMTRKSIISCGVVIDGHPYLEMMFLEKYK